MIKGTEMETKSLEDIIKTSSGGIFNNAAFTPVAGAGAGQTLKNDSALPSAEKVWAL